MDGSTEATRSITFQETFEDLVAVSLVLSQKVYRKQKIRYLLIAVYVLVIGLLIGVSWWGSGYHEPAVMVAGFVCLYALWIGYFLLRFGQLGKRKMHAHLVQFKNIGLATPSTVTLHRDYLEVSSALSSGRYTWDVIESIQQANGYLIFQIGAMGQFVPDQAFATQEKAHQFAQEAIRLANDSRGRSPDLRDAPPWAD